MDLRVLQDFAVPTAGTRHAFQLTLDVLDIADLVRLVRFDAGGAGLRYFFN